MTAADAPLHAAVGGGVAARGSPAGGPRRMLRAGAALTLVACSTPHSTDTTVDVTALPANRRAVPLAAVAQHAGGLASHCTEVTEPALRAKGLGFDDDVTALLSCRGPGSWGPSLSMARSARTVEVRIAEVGSMRASSDFARLHRGMLRLLRAEVGPTPETFVDGVTGEPGDA